MRLEYVVLYSEIKLEKKKNEILFRSVRCACPFYWHWYVLFLIYLSYSVI